MPYNISMSKDSDHVDLPAVCREIRSSLGMTQQEMAEYLKVPYRTYQNWEIGKSEPSAQAAFKLAQMWMRIKMPQIIKDVQAEVSRSMEEIMGSANISQPAKPQSKKQK